MTSTSYTYPSAALVNGSTALDYERRRDLRLVRGTEVDPMHRAVQAAASEPSLYHPLYKAAFLDFFAGTLITSSILFACAAFFC